MNKEALNSEIVKAFCKEFQTVWLIKLSDMSVSTFAVNAFKAVRNSIESVKKLGYYNEARVWYIENVVMEADKSRLYKQTSIEAILDGTGSGKGHYVEYNRIKDGEINYNQICYDRIQNEAGVVEYILMGFRDIDVRKKAERDALTGLYSRQTFLEKGEKLISDYPNVQFDLMLSDIVDFKEINETYGVSKGDAILRWSASILSPLITETFLVGRYGGDQLVILATHDRMQEMNSHEAGSRFVEQEASNGLPNINIKFGIFEDVRRDKSVTSACDKAHLALNSIKNKYGQTIAYYDDNLAHEMSVRRRIVKSMHTALEEKQFEVYYQPKHDALSGKLVGAEALIRWNHPEFGFMSPGDFIPIFERNGFIVEIDDYVWNRTCENLRRWEDEGYKVVPISVNASKLTFEQNDLLDKLESAVKKYNVSPKMLHIEITETLMSENHDLLKNKLSAIKAIGYQIDLDDFGAGYSSIHALSTLPLDVVKLDMSFINQYNDEKRSKVLAACINLAKELGYETVSEGVEYKEQSDMLCVLGVDIIQGYFYSKPLPEKQFEEYMKKCEKA